MCLPNILFPVFMACSLLFFTAAHFHLAGRWHFSFSHRCFEFPCSSPLFSITRSRSSSINVVIGGGSHIFELLERGWLSLDLHIRGG